nr:MFS transporter [Caldimonas sp.]
MNDPAFRLREIAVAAFGPTLLFALGEGAILPVIALTVRQLGGSVALAALMVTLIGIGSLVSNIPASLVTARWGERWAIVGASAWCALGMLICVVATALWAFAIGVFMVGMAAAVFGLARQSYLTDAVPFHFRARALSTLGGVMRIGLFVGPVLGAACIHAFGLAGAYWAGVASLVAAAFVAMRMPELPPHPSAAATPDSADARVAPTLRSVGSHHAKVFLTVGVGALLVAAVRASRQAVIPLWAEGIGLDAAATSLIYGLAGGIDMLVFYPAGKVMDRKGRNWVVVPSMLVM